MQSIKRELRFGVAASAFIFTGALSWGRPFIVPGNQAALAQTQEQPSQPPQQQPAKSTTFTGTIARQDEQFVLQDSSGGVYKLDDSERAKPYEGKSVKVTGQLDAQAKMIHVESIESIEA